MPEEITLGEVYRLCIENSRRIDLLATQQITQATTEWQERKNDRHAFRSEMMAITSRIEVNQQELKTDLTVKVASIIARIDMFQQFGGKSISLVTTVLITAISNIITGFIVYRLSH